MATATITTPRELVHTFSQPVRSVQTSPEYTLFDYLTNLQQRWGPGGVTSDPPPRADVPETPPSDSDVEFDWDDFPQLEDSTDEPESTPINQSYQICRLDSVRNHIRNQLRSSIKLCTLDSPEHLYKEDDIRLYMEALTALDRHREQFAQFIAATFEDQCRFELIPDVTLSRLIRERFEARGDDWENRELAASYRLLKDGIESMAKGELHESLYGRLTFDPQFDLGSSIVTTQLCARDLAHRFPLLKNELLGRIDRLAAWITQVLENGSQNGVFGLVAWIDPTHCWFTHFEQWVRVSNFMFDVVDYKATLGDVTGTFGFKAHEVHLIDAVHFHGIPGWMRLPDRIVKIAHALPPLLRPYIGVVDGTVVRERTISCELVRFKTKDQLEIPLPRPQPDPAIVIGNIVLAGWSDTELAHPIWRSLDRLQALLRKQRVLGADLSV